MIIRLNPMSSSLEIKTSLKRILVIIDQQEWD